MELTFNAEPFLKSFSNFKAIQYQIAVKTGIARYMTLLRIESVKEIIPDSTGFGLFNDSKYRRARVKIQSVNPVKLTSRSGRLIRGLSEGGLNLRKNDFQDLDKKHSTTNPSRFKSLNGVIDGGGKQTEKSPNINLFTARWSPYIRDGSDMLTYWKQMFSAGKGDLAMAKKMAGIRFQHENGLKGNARTFFLPAYLRTRNKLEDFVMESLTKEYKRVHL